MNAYFSIVYSSLFSLKPIYEEVVLTPFLPTQESKRSQLGKARWRCGKGSQDGCFKLLSRRQARLSSHQLIWFRVFSSNTWQLGAEIPTPGHAIIALLTWCTVLWLFLVVSYHRWTMGF